jgi:hypothetical protein
LGLEERVLGDMYVKAEFRAHKDIDNPVQIVCYLTELFTASLSLTDHDRLDFSQSGRCTPRHFRVILGKARRWTRARLIK